MTSLFKQLSRIFNFEFIGLYENTKSINLLNQINKTTDNNISEYVKEFLRSENFYIEEYLYIESLNEYLSNQAYNIPNSIIKSLFIYQFTISNKDHLMCLASEDILNLNTKDKLLIKTLIENHFLKQPFIKNKTDKSSITNELFQIIFNSVPEAISFHQLPDHKAIMINKAFSELTGISEHETLNKTGKELHLWAKEKDRLKYREELEKNGFVNNFVTQFKIKNGNLGIGIISAKIIPYKNKPHVLVIIRDITSTLKIKHDLDDSEEKFYKLFNSLPDPVSINKLDESMAFTNVNDAFIKLTGLNKSDLIGKSGHELRFWDNANDRKEYIDHIRKYGEINNYQAKIKYPNGQTEEGLISAKTIEINNEPHLIVILKSIDSLIKLKKKLEINEKKFRSIFDSSPDAININKLQSGEFVDINRSFTKITGYTKKELIQKSFVEFDFWVDKNDVKLYLERLTSKGSINNFETKIKLKNGNIIHVLISAITIKIDGIPHIVNLSRNIEDVKIIQRGLQESENKFRTIVEKSHSAILIIDEKQKFTYVNPKAQLLFDYSLEELIGMDFEQILHSDSINLVKERYTRRQKGDFVPEQYEFKVVQKNGNIRDVEISSSVYFDQNGKTKTISQLLDITERNRAFSQLKKEQIRAQNYLDIAAFIILSINKDGIIQLVNQKACEILGYKESYLVGKNWFEICLPKSVRDITQTRVINIFNGSVNPGQFENIIVTKNGEERTINWHSTIIYDENNEPKEILSAGEDVTDKINSLKIINKTKTVAIIWKYNKDSDVHPIKYVSQNVEKLLGYSSAELMSKQIRYIDLIHPDDLNRVLSEVENNVSVDITRQYTHDYYRLRTKKGKWIWIEDQTEFIYNEKGEITHFSGLLVDVTERKQYLELIKSNEERYKTVFYSNLDGLAILNEKGEIVEANDVLCEMYGYTKHELLNRKNSKEINIGSDLDLPYVKNQLKKQDFISSESIDTKKDGSRFHVSSKLRWINYNNSNHILAIFRDISDKKASEMDLLKAKEKAEESDQLKSSFLANMSHEIRTPMNAIIGFSSLLEDSDLNEDEKLSFINRIKNNSQQLLRLINDIIDISKIEANQINLVYSKIQINLFFNSLYELFELDAKSKNIHLNYECHDQEKTKYFQSDKNRLTQVITNLLSNALKFTNHGGSILFGSYPSPSTKEIILYVKDTGIGIPKDAQKHIFQRFRQAHEMTNTDYGGTGLGLSIVKGLVDNMNGRIWLNSEEGVGSQFLIALPYSFN